MASATRAHRIMPKLAKGRVPDYPRLPSPERLDQRTPHQRLFQLNPVPATPYVEQLNIGAGRRTFAITLAVLIAGLLLVLLLSWGTEQPSGKKDEVVTVVRLEATEAPKAASKTDTPKQDSAAEPTRSPQPVAEEPRPPEPAAPAPPPPPTPPLTQLPPLPASPPKPPARPVYGPPDRGGSPASRDSERVGTAPNGEPLYAAAWYREPRDDELRGYLSTASGPGWGLIACRTAPDYRVEDCVGLDEYPNGSQINRAVLAAAWQFKVRPPRIGGQSQVGSWVRIRIDYGNRRR